MDELTHPANCNSDSALLGLALAATFNGKTRWLLDLVANDQGSELEWRKRRSVVLGGFLSNNQLPVEGAWPEGEVDTVHEANRRKSARYRYIEACARHWWTRFLSAGDDTEAYAAWILFLRSADRRAWAWVDDTADDSAVTANERLLRLQHLRLNRSRLERAMEKREDKLERQFLGQDIVEGIGPWA